MFEEMTDKALRLKELDLLIVKAISTFDTKSFAKYVVEFNDAKKSIRSYALEHPLLNIQGIEDPKACFIIQKVMSGEPFAVEKAMSDSEITEFLKGELDDNDIENLASDLFYSWFSHYEYIQGIYEIGALTISCSKIPENLSKFVNEARDCYAFQQFNAVFSLCRTILEISIKDVATTRKILPADNRDISYLTSRSPELYDLINQLCDRYTIFKTLRGQLHEIRRKTNSLIHGSRSVKKQEASEMLKKTLLAVHRLYELESKRQGTT
ncbi:hypothetical protein BMS3Abin14_00679 [bacterium BMS3Abin14]|nr:hypothetical protein BMS3Abin14_00679 [bacterium BMS3Abin14]HDZ62144.1 DUF4145 domain-containing protein [Nitrospirota bacterium]